MAQDKPTTVSFPLSDFVTANGFVFLSGVVSPNEERFEEEVRGVMKIIGTHLAGLELTFDDLVSVSIILRTMDNYSAFNKVYSTYFKGKFPSRPCIAVVDLPLHANVEISAVAKEKN